MLPRIFMDYVFLHKQDPNEAGVGMPCFCIYDEPSGVVASHVLPSKGTVHEYNADVVREEVAACGHAQVVLHYEQGPSIKRLEKIVGAGVRLKYGCKVTERESPIGDHQAKGNIEAQVRDAKGQVRVLRGAVEGCVGYPLEKDIVCCHGWSGILVSLSQRIALVTVVGQHASIVMERNSGGSCHSSVNTCIGCRAWRQQCSQDWGCGSLVVYLLVWFCGATSSWLAPGMAFSARIPSTGCQSQVGRTQVW